MGYNIDAQHNAENSTYIWAIRRYSEITIDRIVTFSSNQLQMHPSHVQFFSQFKPQQWNNAIFKLFYNKSYNDSDKCLKIMHDFTNSVIRERKAEYKWVYEKFNIIIGQQECDNCREGKKNSNNDHDMDDGLFRKKKLAFLGVCNKVNQEGAFLPLANSSCRHSAPRHGNPQSH